MRWADLEDFVKIKYVGADFIEVELLNEETLEYTETSVINSTAILEVIINSPDINRMLAEVSCNLPSVEAN